MERETSEARSQPVVRRTQDATVAAQTWRLRRYASEQALARSDAFEQAAAGYMTLATPTVGDLLDHVTRTAGSRDAQDQPPTEQSLPWYSRGQI